MEEIMKTKKVGITLTSQLETGAAILAAARLVDITLVKVRLGAFSSAQRTYVEAQRQVEAADAAVREGQVRLSQRDAEQDEAVEGLARALIGGGQARGNPFAAFGTATPSAVKEMPAAAKTKAIQQLVAAVQSEKSVGKAARHAAQVAEHAAQRAAAARLAVDKLQTTLGNRRGARDKIGQKWKTTLGALKLDARAAAADGASGLYAALFGRPSHARKKAVTPTPAPAPPVVTPLPIPAPAPPAVTEPTA
jgi:hypothetical protein